MKLIRVGITHGDINGISLELITKALSSPELLELCTPVVFSDENCFMQTAKQFQFEQPIPLEVISSAKQAMDGRVNLVRTCEGQPRIEWGQQTEIALKAEADSLNAAVEAFKNGIIDVLICAPGQLDNNLESHSLSDFVSQATGTTTAVFDWVISEDLRLLKVSPIAFTTDLGEDFAIESFRNEIKSIHTQMRENFGFIRPRLAIVANNEKLSTPLKELQEEGITIFGPMSANQFIESGNYKHYDAVLFQEEEEARKDLIKGLNKENTIGVVTGMPVLLAYPLTGVNYEMAGKCVADESALRNAIYAAIDIDRNRHRYQEATRRPLEKQWVPKGRDDFKLDLTKEEA